MRQRLDIEHGKYMTAGVGPRQLLDVAAFMYIHAARGFLWFVPNNATQKHMHIRPIRCGKRGLWCDILEHNVVFSILNYL